MPTITKILFFDAALSYGGTIKLLDMIFNQSDRHTLNCKIVSALPRTELEKYFSKDDICLSYHAKLSYADRESLNQKIKGKNKILCKLAIYSFTIISWILNLGNLIKVLKVIFRERPTVIHSNNTYVPLIPAAIFGIPVVWHIHGVPPKQSKFDKWLKSNVKTYIAISDFIKQESIAAGYCPNKFVTLPNPAPPLAESPAINIRRKYNIPYTDTIICHVGRLIPWKGQLEFLNAFNTALKSNSTMHALVIGDDAEFHGSYKETLRNFVNTHNITEKVTFVGHSSIPLAFMAESDIFVHSSTEPEPFGLVITEAMSTGTAVLASNKGATSEIICHRHNGMLCDPNNVSSFAEILLELATKKKLRTAIANEGLKTATEKFDINTYMKELKKIYYYTTRY